MTKEKYRRENELEDNERYELHKWEKFSCEKCGRKFIDWIFITTHYTGLCRDCRMSMLPKYIPLVQQVQYFKLRGEKNE